MRKIGRIVFALCGIGVSQALAQMPESLQSWPDGADPKTVGGRVIAQFLSTEPEAYAAKGFDAGYPYGGGSYVCYSVASLWVNALEYSEIIGDAALQADLVNKFRPFLPDGEKRDKVSKTRHVDFNVFGAVPLEVAFLVHDKTAREMGLRLADDQWEPPRADDLAHFSKGLACHYVEPTRQLAYLKEGYSGQTRLWIDDMYMINLLQTQAYRVTKNRKYVDRAAKEMVLYLDRLQLGNGLFNHAADVAYRWGRGNGWMAAGMPMILQYLEPGDEHYDRILAGYRKMMETLLRNQRPSGLWGQLVDVPESWDETSGSLMFAYGFVMGCKHGWLDAAAYAPAARKAYLAVATRLDAYGNVPDVCCGTGAENSRQYYFDRKKINGDPHGQAPLLWCVNALLDYDRSSHAAHIRPANPRIVVKSDRPNAVYAVGEEVDFVLEGHDVWGKDGAGSAKLEAAVDNFGPCQLIASRPYVLEKGRPLHLRCRPNAPGFVRLTVTMPGVTNFCTSVAVSPEKIRPGSECPRDFMDFWKRSIADFDRDVPTNIVLKPLPQYSSAKLEAFEVIATTVGGRKLYGSLSRPRDLSKGPYPLLIGGQGAGPASLAGEARGRDGMVLLCMNVHYYEPIIGKPKREMQPLQDKEDAALMKTFPTKHAGYQFAGIASSREDYYYYGAILGIQRVCGWTAAQPYVDANRVYYSSTSQGGGFGLYMGALCPFIRRLAVFVPALTDLCGYQVGRTSGWPRLVEAQTEENRETAAANAVYFDAAHFARFVTCPTRVGVGFSDRTCPPTAVYAAYNALGASDKDIMHGLGMGHLVRQDYYQELEKWLFAE